MAQIDILAQQVALLTQAVNDIYANAKTTGEFPYQMPLVQDSKVRVENGTDSEYVLLSDIINQAGFVLTNKLLYFNGVTIVGNTVTLLAGSVWRVDNNIYSNIANIPFTVPYVSTPGDFRKDLLIGGASNSYVTKIAGSESDIAIEPNYPNNKVIICALKVTDSDISVSESTIIIATDAETQITEAVPEDNKVVSRSKLFNWWVWAKSQAQNIYGIWNFFDRVNLSAGNSTKYPLNIPVGSKLTVPVNGAIETDIDGIYYTINGVRNNLKTLVATDAETQITEAVPEDNKVVSRLKLFNWWGWQKTRAQVFSSYVQADRFTTGANILVSSYSADFYASATKRISIDAISSRIIGQNGASTTNIYFDLTPTLNNIYVPNASGGILLDSTLKDVYLNNFQKTTFSPVYIRVNNSGSDVVEDLRINVASGNNRPFFERCIVADANKGGGMWERAVSTLELNNTSTAVSTLAANTGILMQISDPLLFTWVVDTQSSKTGALVSDLINADYIKAVDDKTANYFEFTFEVSYAPGVEVGELELSLLNTSLLVISRQTQVINVDKKGANKQRVFFYLRGVKRQSEFTGYRLRLINGGKELTNYRLVNISRTNN